MSFDPLDAAILDLLRQNGRMSNREIGRALDISEGTVRQRLKKLEDRKAMRLGVVIDIEAAGMAADRAEIAALLDNSIACLGPARLTCTNRLAR